MTVQKKHRTAAIITLTALAVSLTPWFPAVIGGNTVELVSHLDTAHTVRLIVQGGYAYAVLTPLFDYDEIQLWIFDVSDPSSPTEAGVLHLVTDDILDMVVAGNCACAAVGDEGVLLIDVSNPEVPKEVGRYSTSGFTESVAAEGNYIYLTDRSGTLSIVDVSTPALPFLVGSYKLAIPIGQIVVVSGRAYVTDTKGDIHIIDVSEPTEPTEIGYYDTPGYAIDVAVTEEYAYIAEQGELQIVDISDPSMPIGVNTFHTPATIIDLAVADGYAYAAAWKSGWKIIDVSDPMLPTEVGSYTISDTGVKAVIPADGYVYAVGVHHGIFVFYLSFLTEQPDSQGGGTRE